MPITSSARSVRGVASGLGHLLVREPLAQLCVVRQQREVERSLDAVELSLHLLEPVADITGDLMPEVPDAWRLRASPAADRVRILG